MLSRGNNNGLLLVYFCRTFLLILTSSVWALPLGPVLVFAMCHYLVARLGRGLFRLAMRGDIGLRIVLGIVSGLH